MNNSKLVKFGILVVLYLIVMKGACYTVQETEVVILTQFGRTVGEPVTEAGLHFKIPLIQQVNTLDKRVLGWDGPNSEMPTKDKLYIMVDTFARWRIAQPALFYTSLTDLRSARSRIDDIIGSETRNTVARHALVELVRTTKGRPPIHDEALISAHGLAPPTLPEITSGRVALEDEITKESKRKLETYGIELLNVRFKRINYNPAVAGKIHDRMMSERRQIAELFRSEGAGEAAKISGTRERDIRKLESEAYAKTQIVQGKADAEATAIYAKAFNGSAEAREFYAFQRTMETYKTSFTRDTTFVMTTGEGFLQYLKGETLVPKPKAPAAPTSVPNMPSAPGPPPP